MLEEKPKKAKLRPPDFSMLQNYTCHNFRITHVTAGRCRAWQQCTTPGGLIVVVGLIPMYYYVLLPAAARQ